MTNDGHGSQALYMNLINAKEIKEILEKHSVSIRKSWGQNFLIDENALEKIIEASNLSKKDTVVEVGPGLGALTLSLAKDVKKVIAVEKDRKIIPLLEETLKKSSNVKVVNEDILRFKVPSGKYKVVANVPYCITSPIIRKFLEEKNRPSLLILTVQKEVAERICANPPRMNLLAVSVQFFAAPEVISHISPSSFYPPPNVTSSILRIIPYNKESAFGEGLQKEFFLLVRAGFSHPRKQLIKNLKMSFSGGAIKKVECVGINLERRAETLSIEEWALLAKSLST